MDLSPIPVRNRAATPEEKRRIVERLYEAWLRVPELRLGQFIENVVSDPQRCVAFYVEDFVLAEWAEEYVRKAGR